MAPKQPIIKFSKFLSYILGHRPDEFGLVTDQDGYVKIKDLLKSVSEEEGWRHIRKSAIDEVMVSLPQPIVEMKENLIRAVQRDRLPEIIPAGNMPGLLFTCIRPKAYPHVAQKGISPSGHSHVVLSADKPFAERLGRRIDQKPVVLTVHVNKAIQEKVGFSQFGNLFLADFIPPGTFSGPPLPKEKTEPKIMEKENSNTTEYLPGSYTVDVIRDKRSPKSFVPKKKQKGPDWKKDRKKLRKQKEKMWPS